MAKRGPSLTPDIEAIIDRVAPEFDIDPQIVKGLAMVESGGAEDPNSAVSPRGAVGVMQITRDTLAEFALPVDPAALVDPEVNVRVGLTVLRSYLDRFGSMPLALAAYNGGPTRLDKLGRDISRMPKESRDFVPKVLAAAGIQSMRPVEEALAQDAATQAMGEPIPGAGPAAMFQSTIPPEQQAAAQPQAPADDGRIFGSRVLGDIVGGVKGAFGGTQTGAAIQGLFPSQEAQGRAAMRQAAAQNLAETNAVETVEQAPEAAEAPEAPPGGTGGVGDEAAVPGPIGPDPTAGLPADAQPEEQVAAAVQQAKETGQTDALEQAILQGIQGMLQGQELHPAARLAAAYLAGADPEAYDRVVKPVLAGAGAGTNSARAITALQALANLDERKTAREERTRLVEEGRKREIDSNLALLDAADVQAQEIGASAIPVLEQLRTDGRPTSLQHVAAIERAGSALQETVAALRANPGAVSARSAGEVQRLLRNYTNTIRSATKAQEVEARNDMRTALSQSYQDVTNAIFRIDRLKGDAGAVMEFLSTGTGVGRFKAPALNMLGDYAGVVGLGDDAEALAFIKGFYSEHNQGLFDISGASFSESEQKILQGIKLSVDDPVIQQQANMRRIMAVYANARRRNQLILERLPGSLVPQTDFVGNPSLDIQNITPDTKPEFMLTVE